MTIVSATGGNEVQMGLEDHTVATLHSPVGGRQPEAMVFFGH
jgi:hypothetical protein